MEGQKKIHRSKINTAEWIMIILVLGGVDVAQIILDVSFGVGIAVNRVIDIAVGGLFILYLLLRGELRNEQTRNRVIIAFLATFLIEMVPLFDIAPAWIGDGFYCWVQSRNTNKMADAQEKAIAETQRQAQIEAQQEKIIKLQEMRQRQQEKEELYEEAA